MKVLLLSCGTGGGHNSAALAIEEELNKRNIHSDFKEYLDIINPKIRKCVNKLYIRSTGGNGKLFKQVYRLGELYRKTKIKSPVYQLNSLSKKRLYNYIVENAYDYIVTTHLFAAEVLTKIKKENPIHFIAIATDYVCIPFWEETNPDFFIIPSKALEDDFIQRGIPKEKLVPLGIPVSNRYIETYQKEDIEKELHLDTDKKYILILTGSMGFGNVNKMVEGMIQILPEAYKLMIGCGNNKKLKETLEAQFGHTEKIIAIPYTKQIDKYMKIADILLTKPGGLTTTEIATLRKPFIHTLPIPGCENYNATYFESRGMSLQSKTTEEVIQNVYTILEDKQLQATMIQNQETYIDKEACNKICNFIIQKIQEIKGKE